ncbi:MAG: ATP-binding protein [Nitrospiraceae bacterium]|nr:ATP-binding protein [Nitrospiraceae bacterium]
MEKDSQLNSDLADELDVARKRISQLEDLVGRCAATEETLLQSNEILHTLIDASPVAVINLDPQGRVLMWNKAAETTFGWQANEAIGSFNPIVPEDRKVEFEKIRELAMQGPLTGIEIKRRKKDGSPIDLSLSTAAISDPKGVITGYIAMFLDISARKKAEEELERSHSRLEELVRERTSELRQANEKLSKYSEELESSNRGLEQFAYMASHDLQAPLLAIATNLKMFLRRYREKLDEGTEKFLSDAVDSAIRMQNFIRGLLAYSRTGTRELELKRTDSALALDTALGNLASMIKETGAVITRDKLPVLHTDPSQLPHIFQNLIGNAIKFHGNGPPRAHVSANKQTDPGTGKKVWVFSVKDNGIGIPPEAKDVIFDIFKRLKSGGRYPGAGIGLATCKRIIERLGGSIRVESEAGKGSVFYFHLPAGDE